MNEELRGQLRKRLEVARRLRYRDPKICMEILIDVLDELLKGKDQNSLENENKTVRGEILSERTQQFLCNECGGTVFTFNMEELRKDPEGCGVKLHKAREQHEASCKAKDQNQP